MIPAIALYRRRRQHSRVYIFLTLMGHIILFSYTTPSSPTIIAQLNTPVSLDIIFDIIEDDIHRKYIIK